MRTAPVTLSQAALFFAEEKALTGGGYNFATHLDVRGPVTDQDLVAACHRVVAATPVLRVRMGLDSATGDVVYWFTDEQPPVELQHCVDMDPAAVDALVDAATRLPFDVDEGPLTRMMVLRLGSRHAAVVLIAHHLAVDGVSHARLVERLADAVAGPIEPDGQAPYAELVRRIRTAEDEARITDQEYWLDRVPNNLLSATRLPCHAPARDVATRRVLRLDPANHRHGVAGASAFQVLMAAVHRALPPADSTHTVLCVAASQRRPASAEGAIIGSFVNEVPLVCGREPVDSVTDIVRREGPRWTQDLRRRNVAFIDVAGRVAAAGAGPPYLDSVMVGYRKTARCVVRRHHGLVCRAELDYRYPLAKTELSVRFFDYPDRLECEVQWGGQLPDSAGEAFVGRLRGDWGMA